jgi:hypothetical protein
MTPAKNKLAPSNVSDLPSFEWNFESVPAEELEICFHYEYTREHAKHSNRWHELTKRSKNEKFVFSAESLKKISSIFGQGKHLHFIFNSSFATTPWQALDKQTRRDEAKQFTLDKLSAQNFQEYISLFVALQRDLPENAPAGVMNFDSWVLLDKCFHDEYDQREYGFFAINWNYTDGQLIDEFKKWLATKRGDHSPSASQRGRRKQRLHLRALGAKRLLESGFTVVEAMNYTETILGKDKPLYSNENQWSRAKTQIVPAVLQLLFTPQK